MHFFLKQRVRQLVDTFAWGRDFLLGGGGGGGKFQGPLPLYETQYILYMYRYRFVGLTSSVNLGYADRQTIPYFYSVDKMHICPRMLQ